MPAPRIIVVGGGCKSSPKPNHQFQSIDIYTVSGLSAAHTIYLNGGNVLLLDKNSKSTAR